MYISDESADAVLLTNSKIRDAVEGNSIMLWLPGQGAGVSVNMCLMLGWMGGTTSIYGMVPTLRHAMGWYALLICVVSVIMGIHWFMIIRGLRRARTLMYWHALTTISSSVLVTAVALFRRDVVGAVLASAGLMFALIAARLIAGASYAMFAAFYRAKRTYEVARVDGE